MNKIIILGRLTRNPEQSTTNSGYDVTRFSIASKSSRKNEDGNQETDFFNCLAWGKKGETILRYTQKGSLIQVSGEINSRYYTSETRGRQTVWEVTVDGMEFVFEPKEQDDIPPKPNRVSRQEQVTLEEMSEDLPF